MVPLYLSFTVSNDHCSLNQRLALAYWLIEKKPLAREYFENGEDSIGRQYRNDFACNDSFMSVERQTNHAHDA